MTYADLHLPKVVNGTLASLSEVGLSERLYNNKYLLLHHYNIILTEPEAGHAFLSLRDIQIRNLLLPENLSLLVRPQPTTYKSVPSKLTTLSQPCDVVGKHIGLIYSKHKMNQL